MDRMEYFTVSERQLIERYVECRDVSEHKWKSLQQPFWLKFVITTRNEVIESYPKYLPEESDFVFVEVLKLLVGKKFRKVYEYVSDILTVSQTFKCQTSFKNLESVLANENNFETIFIFLFGENFHNISLTWLAQCFDLHCRVCYAIAKTTFPPIEGLYPDFIIPKFWGALVSEAWPFEAFLRSRWGEKLTELLECTKEQLSWWRSPSGISRSNPALRTAETQLKAEKFKRYHDIVPLWLLPFTKESLKTRFDVGYFFIHLKSKDELILMWELLELTIPPVLAKRFYVCRFDLLTQCDPYKRYLLVCPWFVLWLESFDLKFFNILHSMHQEYSKHGIDSIENPILHSERCEHTPILEEGFSWRDRIRHYKRVLEMALSRSSAPRPMEECAENTSEFLLEPCLLIQLPWSLALFQQWLAAALLEVTRFELASMELRHWPIPESLEALATKLLTVVKRAKERLILGLVLFCKQVTSYPEVHRLIPGMIVDECILPALPALKYLIQGEAYSTLNQLKYQAWTKPTSMLQHRFKSVPLSSYTINKDLCNIYSHHYWHVRYWLQDKLTEPFPYQTYEHLDFQTLVEELKCEVPEMSTSDFCIQNLSQEEKLLMNVVVDQVEDLTSDVPTEFIRNSAQCYFLHDAYNLDKMLDETLATCKQPIQFDPNLETPAAQAAFFSRLGHNLRKGMSGLETSPSVLGCLVRINGESLVCEQEVRVAAACARAFQRTPAFPEMAPELPEPDFIAMSVKVSVVLATMKRIDRNWLQNQFDSEWRIAVEEDDDKIGRIAKSLYNSTQLSRSRKLIETHLGSLVYNVAFHNLKFAPDGKWEFPMFPNLQYILQCTINPFLKAYPESDTFTPQKAAQHFLSSQFIGFSISLFGGSYFQWIESEKIKVIQNTCMHHKYSQFTEFNKVTRKRIKLFLCSINGLSEFCDVGAEIKSLVKALLNWPLFIFTNDSCGQVELLTLEAWKVVSGNILAGMELACSLALQLPCSPSLVIHLKCSELGMLYKSQGIITVLMHCVFVCGMYSHCIKKLRAFEVLEKMHEVVWEWNNDLITYFLHTETLPRTNFFKEPSLELENTDTNLQLYIVDGREMLSKLFNLIESIRLLISDNLMRRINLPDVRKYRDVIEHFREGDLEKVARSFRFKVANSNDKLRVEDDMRELAKKYLNIQIDSTVEAVKKKPQKKGSNDTTIAICRWCKKRQQKGENFVTCLRCKEEKYPDINYYCKDKCRERCWKKQHKAEHLEFDLGLTDWVFPVGNSNSNYLLKSPSSADPGTSTEDEMGELIASNHAG